MRPRTSSRTSASAPGTSIWHRAQVRTGATIGAECVVGRDVFIDEGVTIGDRVKIQNLALVYHGVTVEDGVFIGPGAILTNDRYPRAITSTGDLARADDWTVSPILLRDGCSIGAGAVVVAGVEVGRFATVGAGGVVTRTSRSTPSSSAARPTGSAGSAPAARASSTANGEPGGGRAAAATPPTPELSCASCGRTYAYIPDAEIARGADRPASRSTRMIPIARPDIGPEEIAAVTEVLASGMVAQGRKVRPSSRQRWADFVGVKHAIAMANGTLVADVDLRRHRPRAGRRGHHGLAHVRRDGERDPLRPARRRSSSTSSRTRT